MTANAEPDSIDRRVEPPAPDRHALARTMAVGETDLRHLVEQMASGLIFCEVLYTDGAPVDHRLLYANPAFERHTGLSVADQVGLTGRELAFGWPASLRERFYDIARTGEAFDYERYNDTLGRWFDVRAFSPAPGQFALSFFDISARKRAEEALSLRATALDAADNVIVFTDRNGRIEWANEAFTRVTGYTLAEAVGRTPALLNSGRHDPAYYERLWSTITAGRVWRGEVVNRRKDGTLFTEEMTITPLRGRDGDISHFIAVKQDITQRKQLEEQLRQKQKMESIGRLAGGVAHDFNNQLNVILGFLELALDGMGPTEALYADLMEIQHAALRSVEITRQLLTFARQQPANPQVIDLGHHLEHLQKMLRRLIGERIALTFRAPTGVWPVFMDAAQLDQILVNLCLNARDAIDDIGSITVTLANCTVGPDTTGALSELPAGDYVRLGVSDDGRGMPPDVREHIFEPFFTTKDVGAGTGLGLSIVYGAVRQHGGTIAVHSAAGAGTTFDVMLPRHVGGPAGDDEPARPRAPQGSETILVVEDEPAVRRVIVRTLERLGYDVLDSGDPEQALALAADRARPFDLVVSDVMMPKMNGYELAGRLRASVPGLRIVFMSGFTPDELAQAEAAPEARHLAKPVSSAMLAAAVREALDAR